MSYYPVDVQVYSIFSALSGLWLALLIPSLAIAALTIAAKWAIFEKAGEPGWAALIPFYNSYVLYKISWGNGWFFLLVLIPFANFVVFIITMIKLSQAFGKDGAWAVGLIFLYYIFLCIMAFSKDIQYVGLSGQQNGGYGYGGTSGSYQQSGYQQNTQGFQNPYYTTNSQTSGATYQQPAPPQNQATPTYQQSAQNPQYYYNQTASSAKFCTNCGVALDGSPKFCHKCGKPQ